MIGNSSNFDFEPKQMSTTALSQPTLVAQILSGYHDPVDGGRPYTSVDYQFLGAGLFSKIAPKQLMKELSIIFNSIQVDDQKSILLHNAKALITRAIQADINQEFQFEILAGFSTLRNNGSNSTMTKSFVDAITLEIEKANRCKEQVWTRLSQVSTPKKTIFYLDDAQAFAKDLKIHNLYNLANLKLSNFFNKNWVKNNTNVDFPATIVTRDFDKLSDIVKTDILSSKDKKDQKKRVKLYFEVIEHCIMNGDYISAQAITAAMNSAPITRLKYLHVELKSAFDKFEETSIILDQRCNFKALYDDMQIKISRGVIVIPPLNLLSRNITFIEEANPDQIQYGSVTKENEAKISLIGQELIKSLIRSQSAILGAQELKQTTDFMERYSAEPCINDDERLAMYERASFAIRGVGDLNLLINPCPQFTPNLLSQLRGRSQRPSEPVPVELKPMVRTMSKVLSPKGG